VSAVVTTAIMLAVLRAALVAYVTVVAVRTDDKDRQQTAVKVLEILFVRRRRLPRGEREA
jgi:hypothetical protein